MRMSPLTDDAQETHIARSFRPACAPPLLQSRGYKKVCARSVAVETQAKRFFVSGRVQGVGFRFFAERTAASLGVGGYVRNLFDGRVEVYAIGSGEQMDALRGALRRGPRMSAVEQVDERDAEILLEYTSVFTIERDE